MSDISSSEVAGFSLPAECYALVDQGPGKHEADLRALSHMGVTDADLGD